MKNFLEQASRKYYEGDPIISDDEFDALGKRLLDEWDQVEHMHKHLITKDDLMAGTGYAIKYTNMIKGAANRWHQLVKG